MDASVKKWTRVSHLKNFDNVTMNEPSSYTLDLLWAQQKKLQKEKHDRTKKLNRPRRLQVMSSLIRKSHCAGFFPFSHCWYQRSRTLFPSERNLLSLGKYFWKSPGDITSQTFFSWLFHFEKKINCGVNLMKAGVQLRRFEAVVGTCSQVVFPGLLTMCLVS